MRHQFHLFFRLLASCLLLISQSWADELALADAHLHYNRSHTDSFNAEAIAALLQENNVRLALVTSAPPSLALELARQAPQNILPILGVYDAYADKQSWYQDTELAKKIQRELTRGNYRGIGELHLFAANRRSQLFREVVSMSSRRRLPLLMHCDTPVIDALFEHSGEPIVIWAHAGASPNPPLLQDYLDRYPNLFIELSMRNERIAPAGVLDGTWETLFMEYPDRFMVGVDTFSVQRWKEYPMHASQTRDWLKQLPDAVAEKIALSNAQKLFGHE